MLAKKYASGRTKTTAAIKSMAHFTQNKIIGILKNNPFRLDAFKKLFFFFNLKELKCICKSDKN